MELRFLFFNGLENNSYLAAKNRLEKLNRSVSVSAPVEYEFFQIEDKDKTSSIHNSDNIDTWMASDRGGDEVVVALLHYTEISDVATRARKWNSNLAQRLFVLLFTGGKTTTAMRTAANQLVNRVVGAWALEETFSNLLDNEAWRNLHSRLRNASDIEGVKAVFQEMMPAINGPDMVVINNDPGSPAAEDAAESDQPKGAPQEVPRDQLGIALETLLEAAQLAQDSGAAAPRSLTKKLEDQHWWRRGFSGLPKGVLKKELKLYVQKYRTNVQWGAVDRFLEKVFSDTGAGLLDAAREAHRALKR